jgi:hypothetical protein
MTHVRVRIPRTKTPVAAAPLPLFFLLALLVGCASTQKGCSTVQQGISHLVEIEYDHRLTFQTYNMSKQLPYSGGGGTSELIANGRWLVYHICLVRNEKSEAKDFHFDLSKLFVVHKDKSFHPKQFGFDDLNLPDLGAVDFPVFFEQFRQEVFTAPGETVIKKNSSQQSLNWRFAILVRSPIGDVNAFSPKLRYATSGDEAVLLTSRGWSPNVMSEAEEASLFSTCRPQQ